jgi:hypothetical protein
MESACKKTALYQNQTNFSQMRRRILFQDIFQNSYKLRSNIVYNNCDSAMGTHVRRGKQPLLLIKNQTVQPKEEFAMETSIPIY